MKLAFHNLVLGVLAVLLHSLPAHKAAYGFSHEHGLSIIDPDYASVKQIIGRSNFPPGFTFGFASAAYQTEGAWNVDGKGPSQWDNFTHTYPERVADRSNGDNATNSYYLYTDDVQLLKELNADAYRFSISWSRVLPNGRVDGGRGINLEGIEYYNHLIDDLIAKGLKPCVTMYHFDLPQALQEEYGGLLDQTQFRKDFYDYADLLFCKFGDRVKQWITINQPRTVAFLGYDVGSFPPNRCSSWMNKNCFGADSATEPYIVAHNLLLAHADVVQLYRSQYKEKQNGIIGIAFEGTWPLPYNVSNPADKTAAKRYIDYSFGWFLNPITFGCYPQSMRNYVGERLPKFTAEESLLVRGSVDFVGLSYYTAVYISDINISPEWPKSYGYDIRVEITHTNVKGKQIGEKLGLSWQYSYPRGIWRYLRYIKRYYKDPIIYITDNGASEVNRPNVPLRVALRDNFRMKFHFLHLAFVLKAIDSDNVKVEGYFAWSLTDKFEWIEGYTIRFGIIYIDYNTFRRFPKLSAHWFQRFLEK